MLIFEMGSESPNNIGMERIEIIRTLTIKNYKEIQL